MDNEGIRVFVHAGSSTFRRWWWRAWWKINWYPEFLAVLKGLPLMNRVWIEESKERIDISFPIHSDGDHARLHMQMEPRYARRLAQWLNHAADAVDGRRLIKPEDRQIAE